MRLLLAHNFYSEDGGENSVFRSITALLRQRGHEVIEYTRDSGDAQTLPARAALLAEGLYSARTAREVRSLVARERPDLAIVQNVFPLITPSIYVALREAKAPVAQLVYNYRFICPDAHLYTQGAICERCVRGSTLNAVRYRCYRHSILASAFYAAVIGWHRRAGTFQHIDHFGLPDNFMRHKLGEGGLPMDRMTVLGNPFEPPLRPPRLPEENYVLFVGRIVQQKGLLTLIRALAQADESARLIVVGDGDDRARCEAEGARLLGNRVGFRGAVWGEPLADLLGRSMAVAIPSEWYDNAPLILYQAFAFGKPAIASAINGLPEVVTDGVDGLLARPGDVADWAGTLKRLLASPDLRRRLGEAARRKAEAEFTPDAFYARLTKIFHALLPQAAF
jgi:glycosyltransferase involved in cell wall biosynthesis